MINSKQSRNSNRQGVVLPLIAVLSVFLMVMVVFFVDVAYMQLTRTQLQAATDAAAKAGCEAIDANTSEADIKQAAIDIAALNEVAGQPLILEMDDIVLGSASENADGSWGFNPNGTPYTAVRVTGTKSESKPSGAVPLFFAGTLGVNTFTPSQDSTATQFEHEVMLVCDRSHSMCFDLTGDDWSYPGKDSDPGLSESITDYCLRPHKTQSRWAALYNGVNAFLNIVESNGHHMQQTVGLVTWGSAYTFSCDPTITFPAARLEHGLGYNYNGMRSAMEALGNNPMQGGTNMSAGLDAGINELIGPNSNPLAKKTLILFTDGQWNEGDDPATRVAPAQANNITIHVISLLDAADPAEMDALAVSTGGIHYQASTAQELLDAFGALARSLPVVLTK